MQTFTITVYSINRAPSFTIGPDQSLDEDAGPQVITSWATNISPGLGANETNQQLNFIVTNDSPPLFAVQPSIDASGKLTYQIAAEQTGTARVSVRLHDDGGTAHGGVDTSASQTFTISATGVAPVAPPDSFVLSASASSGGHGSTRPTSTGSTASRIEPSRKACLARRLRSLSSHILPASSTSCTIRRSADRLTMQGSSRGRIGLRTGRPTARSLKAFSKAMNG
jgi:hypothetical protein